MNPSYGKIYSSATKRQSNITSENAKEFKHTGETKKLGTLRCAVFKKEGDDTEYLQPWNEAHLRVYGEKNISAKLNTNQVRAIVRDCYTKTDKQVTFAFLAEKYGVTAKTISAIAHGKAWRHVTKDYIEELVSGNKEVVESCISATNKQSHKTNKLSPSMAKFIVRDNMVNKVSVKELAKKFCVAESTVRRVLRGEMYAEATTSAIKEYSKWK